MSVENQIDSYLNGLDEGEKWEEAERLRLADEIVEAIEECPRRKALLMHLCCDGGEYEPDSFDADGTRRCHEIAVGSEDCGDYLLTDEGEFLVVDDLDAGELFTQAVECYIDDCILPGAPEILQRYFDYESFKRDESFDGRGYWLASYDGEEHEIDLGASHYPNRKWYVYRTN